MSEPSGELRKRIAKALAAQVNAGNMQVHVGQDVSGGIHALLGGGGIEVTEPMEV